MRQTRGCIPQEFHAEDTPSLFKVRVTHWKMLLLKKKKKPPGQRGQENL